MGALVLLLIGVVGFPLLFETQPRPLPANTPIYLPEGTPAHAANPAPARPEAVVPPDAGTEAVATAATAAKAASTPAAQGAVAAPTPTLAPIPVPAPMAAAVAPTPPRPATSAAAVAAVSRPPPPSASAATPGAGRFVVQVGAYNDAERMKAAREKVEKLGYKSYTQDVNSADGKRTRVRAGPFATRQEADAAASKLKAAGLQTNVLSL